MDTDLNQLSEEEKVLFDKILATAQELFMTIGVRNVTMDDLASQLGVSKKTLYKFIENKAGLVQSCIQTEISKSASEVNVIKSSSNDAIEEMMLIGQMVIESVKRFNANTIVELKKFYPECWKLVEKHHHDFVLMNIKNNILRGIKEGLYRPEINVEIIARLYVGKSQFLLELNEFGDQVYNPSELFMEFFSYHIRGIASAKGIEKLAQNKNNLKF
jgi:AcrR family transcriptional regulator